MNSTNLKTEIKIPTQDNKINNVLLIDNLISDTSTILILSIILFLIKKINSIKEDLIEKIKIEKESTLLKDIDDILDEMLFKFNLDKITFARIIFESDIPILVILLEKNKEYVRRFFNKMTKIPLSFIKNKNENELSIESFDINNCDFLKLYRVQSMIRIIDLNNMYSIGMYNIKDNILLSEELKENIKFYCKKIELTMKKYKKKESLIDYLINYVKINHN